jgi:hypothetical protein
MSSLRKLYGQEELHFRSPFQVHIAVQRLAAVIQPSPISWASFTRERPVLGTVRFECVRLYRVPVVLYIGPLLLNLMSSFAYPRFLGRFQFTGRQTVLVGTFGLGWIAFFAATFLTATSVSILLVTLLALIAPDVSRATVLSTFGAALFLSSLTV